MALYLDPVPSGAFVDGEGRGLPPLVRWMNSVKAKWLPIVYESPTLTIFPDGTTTPESVGINMTPTFATFQAYTGVLGSTANDRNYQFFTLWNNGTTNSSFGWYAYRTANGSTSATEAIVFQYFKDDATPTGFFQFGPSTNLILGSNDTNQMKLTPEGLAISPASGASTATAYVHIAAGTATASTAPLKFTSGTNNSTAEAGAVEYNGSSLQYTDGSTARGLVPRTLFVATADKTIANTTTETTLFGSGVGSLTLPANFFVAGRSVRVNLYGFIAGVTTPNIRLRAKLGSNTISDTGAIVSGLTLSVVEGLILSVIMTCRSTGSSGTVIGQAYWQSDGATDFQGSETNATTTVNTTTSQNLDVTWEWGTASASNTLTITNATVEVLH